VEREILPCQLPRPSRLAPIALTASITAPVTGSCGLPAWTARVPNLCTGLGARGGVSMGCSGSVMAMSCTSASNSSRSVWEHGSRGPQDKCEAILPSNFNVSRESNFSQALLSASRVAGASGLLQRKIIMVVPFFADGTRWCDGTLRETLNWYSPSAAPASLYTGPRCRVMQHFSAVNQS